MTRYAKRIDNNQKDIVKELRENGFTVDVTSHIGNGFWDILVSKDRVAFGVEIKDVGKSDDLTDEEIKFKSWMEVLGIKYVVAETTGEILAEFEKLRDKRLKRHKLIK